MIAEIALGVIIGLAQATEPTGTLTLACSGTTAGIKQADKPEPISMGIIIDFAARTLDGFPDAHFPIWIDDITETAISFSGSKSNRLGTLATFYHLDGRIDRITGAVYAELFSMVGAGEGQMLVYTLKCTPAQRKF